ncbi:MAG TPA: TonB-dependent receptor [Ohtaekwangia sp.]|uniref:TonB-dependent receptor n=1 Tax=Ohtaekwangia sp. TaxID=2066019 RepID=UPI002F93FA91
MRRILLFLVFATGVVSAALAQGVTTASMSGQVSDQNGEPLPGVNVVATHVPSGTVYGTVTRADGYYNFPAMRVGGPYTIKVSFVGYKEQVKENVYLQLGQTFSSNYKLSDESTQLAEVVISGTQDPTLNSDKMGASSNFSVNQIQTIPSIGRDFRDISRLTPQAGGSAFSFGGRSNLYNNLTIDGATVNNVFGLNPLPGGQSNATPFSMDAIQEITVSLSPYDVRQGNFTGAGVSAVTRSGTNEFTGSAYFFFRNQGMAGKKVDGVNSPVPSFNFKNYGFRIGGPIIKDKLFFFANLEFEKRTDPFYTNPVRPNKAASTQGATQATDDNDPETGLAGLRDFLISKYNYDPGVYKDFNRATDNIRYVLRLDYNINANNKLTLRGNVTNAYQDQPPSTSGGFVGGPPGGRGNTNNVLSFSSSYYRINNNQYSVTAELNSILGGGKYSNNLVAGFSSFRDFRENAGGLAVPDFPLVDILGPNGQNMTTFGPDPFTKNNKLDQNVIQLNDNFNIYLKNHTVTVGTANELYTFNNVFTQVVNGVYRYNSLADFYADADPATTTTARPAQYTTQYVAVPGGPSATAAKWSALQLGFFAQDEYTGFENLKITGGVRVDIPLYLTDLPKNNYINSINLNGEQLRVGGWPQVRPLISPRIGFNWDVKGDRTTQLRGGTGVLTGRVPFVWLSNAVSNNGLFFGQLNTTSVPFDVTGDGFPYNFSTKPYVGNPEQYSNLQNGTPALITNPLDRNYGRSAIVPAVNTVAKNFKFPQVWRTNIAIDQQLPGGVVGTLEFIYTKDINAVYLRDANLADSKATLAGDGRPLYGAAPGSPNVDRAIISNDRRINGDIGQALVLDNTNKGYQWSITAQLQKTFNRNFQVSAAYTYTDAREINPQNGSTAGGIFSSQANVLGPNRTELSYAGALTPHRVIAYGTYRIEYFKHFATTFGLTYEGRSGSNFSYLYNGDPNSDGTTGNDLIYIPKSKEEIVLSTASATDSRTLDQIWQQLDNYISQDHYLNSRRGKYAERNAAYSPWVNRLNLSLLQDFYVEVKGKRHTIQLSANLDNALNLFNSSWGLIKNPARNQLIRFLGYEQPHTAGTVGANGQVTTTTATTGKPIYTFEANADGTPLNKSFIPDQTLTSGGRWQLQLGVRYIF